MIVLPVDRQVLFVMICAPQDQESRRDVAGQEALYRRSLTWCCIWDPSKFPSMPKASGIGVGWAKFELGSSLVQNQIYV
jgi:hypothetical protein